jgi:hypothetical protein
MTKLTKCFLLGSLSLLLASCGGGSNSNSGSGNTQLSGQWNLTVGSNAIQANLVSSSCTVPTTIGTFDVNEADCFLADDVTNQGSISGSGQFVYPPVGVLIGASVATLPSSGTIPFQGFYVEANQSAYSVWDINGTITQPGSTMSGTYACDSQTPVCFGIGGSFSGTHQ